ncbi:exodeoxyribonuclease VII large subunit [Aquincola sp. S2]|uniref:Exodeoxyribonuclease 7 large subunit n=1 Tax=Pseudaquabacterium terrae TaxID=2732868 RepID=A0ABX2ENC5_9BURK|nr:exodeoxyribonuclease VII large subunit [Aquabacterium terrae]NRF70060.1 exodeoxyribonuclease VII large subunit [Aquabacterium terrae]
MLNQTPPPARAWSVAALLLAASDALQSRLGSITVRGELTGFTRAASGHCYFTLKDDEGQAAVLRCAMFRRASMLLDFRPADGQQVELRGRIGVYEARGELQCVVESMQRLGAGSLYELFLRSKARLEAAGLFDAARKRPIAAYPARIGVVTSLAAAALHDVLSAIRRRAPHVGVIVYPAPVQGTEAPAQLAEAIRRAGVRAEVETLIVCRGGGSLEDLWAFNEEIVVRAVAASPIPVVCGVGHETDVCLAELAADRRAPTPTAAAEFATPLRDDELQRLAHLERRLREAVQRRLDTQAQRLDRLALRLGRPARLLSLQVGRLQMLQQRGRSALLQTTRLQRRRIDELAQRLAASLRRTVAARHDRLVQVGARLEAADPRQVLARGYAWISDAGGRPVTTAQALQRGQPLLAQWSDGQADLEVSAVRLDRAPDGAG